MSKHTAVEWLVNQILTKYDESFLEFYRAEIYQAKAIEREQIEKAYDAGHDDGHDEANGDGSYYDTKEDYYERTYGKEASYEG